MEVALAESLGLVPARETADGAADSTAGADAGPPSGSSGAAAARQDAGGAAEGGRPEGAPGERPGAHAGAPGAGDAQGDTAKQRFRPAPRRITQVQGAAHYYRGRLGLQGRWRLLRIMLQLVCHCGCLDVK